MREPRPGPSALLDVRDQPGESLGRPGSGPGDKSTGFFTIVLGGSGNDVLRNVGTGQARLNGNDGQDQIFGGTVDSLFGQNGDDELFDGLFLRGGSGDDTLRGGSGNDSMFGDDGFDNLDGGAGFDDLCATAEITSNCEAF